jgi:ABC-type nitrate/sulfonate/bicarbonate transport system permease component
MTRLRLPSWAIGVLGSLLLVALWWIAAQTVFSGVGAGQADAVPTPPEVVQQWAGDGWSFYSRNFGITLHEAILGFLWGNALALLLAAVVLLVPRAEGLIVQIATISYCIPIVAIGPLVLITAGAPESGEPSGTAVFLAALSCFFTTVVGALLGLKAADPAALDVVSVYGGNKLTQLRKVRIVAALPSILNALQIAVPAAFLGAILGEYFGKVDVGIGPAMTAAQQGLNAPRVWGIALASGAVAIVGFAFFGLIARLVTPWSRGGGNR